MPAMPRINTKAKKIAKKILGKPANANPISANQRKVDSYSYNIDAWRVK